MLKARHATVRRFRARAGKRKREERKGEGVLGLGVARSGYEGRRSSPNTSTRVCLDALYIMLKARQATVCRFRARAGKRKREGEKRRKQWGEKATKRPGKVTFLRGRTILHLRSEPVATVSPAGDFDFAKRPKTPFLCHFRVRVRVRNRIRSLSVFRPQVENRVVSGARSDICRSALRGGREGVFADLLRPFCDLLRPTAKARPRPCSNLCLRQASLLGAAWKVALWLRGS